MQEWHTKLIKALWDCRTTYKTSTKATPNLLIFRVEDILPLNVELSSLWVVI